jgi:hypothetical protein
VLAAVAAAAASLALGSCGADEPPILAPGAAADALGRNLELSPAQVDCLRGRFESTPGAAAALDTDVAPSDTDRDAFLVVLRACLPPEEFATTLATMVQAELADATDAQATCIHDGFVALDPADQDRLYLYFANPAVLDVADVGDAGSRLIEGCGLVDDAPGSTTTAEPSAAPVTPTAP